jgi:hypothetical protein
MRNLKLLDRYRQVKAGIELYGFAGDETCGIFIFQSPRDGLNLMVIASCGEGWEHVSVSRRDRCPDWHEMDYIAKTFFKEDETVVQYHVPLKEGVNVCDTALHLWRPQEQEILKPPTWMI